jgi:hypothetical protein
LSIFFLIVHTTFVNAQKDNNSALRAREPFRLTRDTVQVSIEGRLDHALFVNDKYYALYEVRDSMSTLPIRKFYVIKKNGQIDKEIKLPNGILEDTYPKIYYWRNRILINTEFYKGTYWLYEDKGQFHQMPEIFKVPLFDNEKTEVTSECHGEFGSTIYFKNKQTGTIYSDHSGCPTIVNKVGDKYFVNASGNIVEIQDPTITNTAAPPTDKVLFKNYGFGSDFYIPTSFLIDSTLYLIYNFYHNEFRLNEKSEHIVITKDSVKIGTIHDGVFNPVYTFKDKFHIQFEQHIAQDYQICIFHTEDRIQIGFKADHPPYMEEKYGLIEIAGKEIKIHYFISKRGR